MRLHLNDIKRMNICPILYENSMDYRKSNQVVDAAFIFGMKEIVKWNYRRNKTIDLGSFLTAFGRYCFKNDIDDSKRIDLEKAFRSFINSDFYLKIKNIFINYKTDVIFNKDQDVLEYDIPLILTKGNAVYITSYNIGKMPYNFILNQYETWYSVVWCFYVLNKTPKLLNFYYDENSIKQDIIVVNQDYILKAKNNLAKLGKQIKINSLPPVEVCTGCDYFGQCERFVSHKKIKEGIK